MELLHLFFSFQGRINRLAYWLGSILTSVLSLVIYTVVQIVGAQMKMDASQAQAGGSAQAVMSVLAGSLAVLLLVLVIDAIVFWMSLAVSMKRWHDRGKSGWWVLMGFLPIVGWIWTFVECGCLPGDPGANQYGPSPDLAKVAATFE
jgi:uncharacterized membrane protein YhaH (DUF805 family)